ncbi:hypothetical protein C1645_866167 [Glomus cerebriforme]|uniref:HMG box domain-containing protein n=1 Tax=Glomus cerebriforme TaxID=658196 RepID=A0A397TL21_9GLOM|nr:hypothetical protein C1645_866167 [Glomus cerebriforme]
MSTQNFSIEDLAVSLIDRLDRRNIFPPYYNNPETLISSSNTLNCLSSRRPRRSPNAFLLCRKNVHQEAKRKGTCNMRVISKVSGILWRNASPEEKSVYERLADKVNELHSKRTSVVYKESNLSLLPKNQNSSSYKPYSIPPQLNSPLTLLNTPLTPLNTPLSLPTSYPPPSISDNYLSNPSSSFDHKDDFFLHNTPNYLNPSFNNQIIPSSNNNNNQLLSYIYNSYLAPSTVSSQNFF